MQYFLAKMKFVGGCILAASALFLVAPQAAQAKGSAALSYTYYKTKIEFHVGGKELTGRVALKEATLTLAGTLAPSFGVALKLGYTETKPHPGWSNNLSNDKLYGNLVGISAKWQPSIVAGWIDFMIQASYTRHDLDWLQWYQTKVKAGPILKFGPVLISGGGYWLRYDGDAEVSGVSVNFEAKQNSGTYAAIGYGVDGDSYIRLYKRMGAQEGFGIIFSGGF